MARRPADMRPAAGTGHLATGDRRRVGRRTERVAGLTVDGPMTTDRMADVRIPVGTVHVHRRARDRRGLRSAAARRGRIDPGGRRLFRSNAGGRNPRAGRPTTAERAGPRAARTRGPSRPRRDDHLAAAWSRRAGSRGTVVGAPTGRRTRPAIRLDRRTGPAAARCVGIRTSDPRGRGRHHRAGHRHACPRLRHRHRHHRRSRIRAAGHPDPIDRTRRTIPVQRGPIRRDSRRCPGHPGSRRRTHPGIRRPGHRGRADRRTHPRRDPGARRPDHPRTRGPRRRRRRRRASLRPSRARHRAGRNRRRAASNHPGVAVDRRRRRVDQPRAVSSWRRQRWPSRVSSTAIPRSASSSRRRSDATQSRLVRAVANS